MREKLAEYAAEGAAWPQSAAILDPVRLSIVVSGPSQIVQTARWFTNSQPIALSSHHSSGRGIKNEISSIKGGDCFNRQGKSSSEAGQPDPLVLPVVRVKNKFAFAATELKGGYRDMMLSVLHEDTESSLRIIGEIQVIPGVCCKRQLINTKIKAVALIHIFVLCHSDLQFFLIVLVACELALSFPKLGVGSCTWV